MLNMVVCYDYENSYFVSFKFRRRSKEINEDYTRKV